MADAAVRRLAEIVTTGTRLVNAPIYLTSGRAAWGVRSATVTVAEFADYALTIDLLETGLVDAVAAGLDCRPGTLPLRGRFLPGAAAVLGVDQRLCAGGPLALCAIARPGSRIRSADDLLLIRERSGSVLNAGRRLAVVPTAFHQALSDHAAGAALAATLERELGEELLGRGDVAQPARGCCGRTPCIRACCRSRCAGSPAIPATGGGVECTGFGLNLVSGDFEFASLIAITDEQWWVRLGGSIQANWESAGLRCYSSVDRDLLAQLCHDPARSNEGLFALLQGFGPLAVIDEGRVNLPTIDLEV